MKNRLRLSFTMGYTTKREIAQTIGETDINGIGLPHVPAGMTIEEYCEGDSPFFLEVERVSDEEAEKTEGGEKGSVLIEMTEEEDEDDEYFEEAEENEYAPHPIGGITEVYATYIEDESLPRYKNVMTGIEAIRSAILGEAEEYKRLAREAESEDEALEYGQAAEDLEDEAGLCVFERTEFMRTWTEK